MKRLFFVSLKRCLPIAVFFFIFAGESIQAGLEDGEPPLNLAFPVEESLHSGARQASGNDKEGLYDLEDAANENPKRDTVPDNMQMMIDNVVQFTVDHQNKQAMMFLSFGAKYLTSLHSQMGHSALHAAVLYDNLELLMQIKWKKKELYQSLLILKNADGKTVLQLLVDSLIGAITENNDDKALLLFALSGVEALNKTHSESGISALHAAAQLKKQSLLIHFVRAILAVHIKENKLQNVEFLPTDKFPEQLTVADFKANPLYYLLFEYQSFSFGFFGPSYLKQMYSADDAELIIYIAKIKDLKNKNLSKRVISSEYEESILNPVNYKRLLEIKPFDKYFNIKSVEGGTVLELLEGEGCVDHVQNVSKVDEASIVTQETGRPAGWVGPEQRFEEPCLNSLSGETNHDDKGSLDSCQGVTDLKGDIKLTKFSEKTVQYSLHPFVRSSLDISMDFDSFIDTPASHKIDQPNLDLFKDSSFQQESLGRENCIIHPGFAHGVIKLDCCDAYICIDGFYQLAINLVSDFAQSLADDVPCPGCGKEWILDSFIEILSALSSGNGMLQEWDDSNQSCQLKEQMISFSKQLLSKLEEYKAWRRHFEVYCLARKYECCVICDNKTACLMPSCHHWLCLSCLKQSFSIKSQDLTMPAQANNCCPQCDSDDYPIDDSIVKVLSGVKVLHNMQQQRLRKSLAKNKNLRECCHLDCKGINDFSNELKKGSHKVIFSPCKHTNCLNCKVSPYHYDLTCQQYQEALTENGADEALRRLMENDKAYMKCPQCERYIFVAEGCSHITCPICQEIFCWHCYDLLTGLKNPYSHFGRVVGKCSLRAPSSDMGMLMVDSNRVEVEKVEVEKVEVDDEDERNMKCIECGTENSPHRWFCGHACCDICKRIMGNYSRDLVCRFCMQKYCPGLKLTQ